MTLRRYPLLAAAFLVILASCGSQPEPETAAEPAAPVEETTEAPAETPATEAPAVEEPVAAVIPPPAPTPAPKAAPAPPKKAAPAGPPVVVMTTNKGTIRIELFPDKAPKTVANFLAYVDDNFYDGTIFHRVIPDFMIQGGGFTADMAEKNTRAPIQNESQGGESNVRGTISMARTNDPHSATAQFFINHANNRMLDYGARGVNQWGYAVFGRVTEGMDVVDAIAVVPTGNSGPYQNVPVDGVVIESVRRAN
jgi:cyclophilin family peptidyl-prolyl cis-trans isomerase